MQKARWGRTTASDCRVSGESLDGCLIFFSFPQEEWISFKENQGIIERLNKEFKRRTKPMEIGAEEQACYSLLGFVSLKMKLRWRSNQ